MLSLEIHSSNKYGKIRNRPAERVKAANKPRMPANHHFWRRIARNELVVRKRKRDSL
jgi:hypothetical protein